MLAVANSGSCIGPQNKIGHPGWGKTHDYWDFEIAFVTVLADMLLEMSLLMAYSLSCTFFLYFTSNF